MAAPRHPFGYYLATQASWFFAFGLQTTLVPHLVKNVLGLGEAKLGLAQATLTAPALVFLVLTGVIAERLDRRLLLVALHVAACIPPAVLAWATGGATLTYPVIIAYGLTMGLVGSVMMPTRDAALNAVAEAQGALSVQRAVVLASGVQFVAQISGMASAALAPRLMGTDPVSALIALQTLAIALGAFAAWRLPPLAPEARERRAGLLGGAVHDLKDGFGIVWHSPIIRPMTIAMFAVGVFVVGGGFFVLLPSFVTRLYEGGLSALGLVLMAFWTGAAVSTVALARFGHVRRPGRLLALAFSAGAAAFAALALPLAYPVFVLLAACWGASAGIGIAMSRAIVQEAAPKAALARVLSIYQLGFMGGAPIGTVLMGLVAEVTGPRLAALIPMVGIASAAVWIGVVSPVGKLVNTALHSDDT